MMTNEDDIKDEAIRLCGPMHRVVTYLRAACDNPTGEVVDEGTVSLEAQGRKLLIGIVRFHIEVHCGHALPSRTRHLLSELSESALFPESEFQCLGLDLRHSEYRSVREVTHYYSVGFRWWSDEKKIL